MDDNLFDDDDAVDFIMYEDLEEATGGGGDGGGSGCLGVCVGLMLLPVMGMLIFARIYS